MNALSAMIPRRVALLRIGVLALLAGCSPATVLNDIAARGNFVRTADIAYGPDPRMKLDIYQPSSRPSHAPVVVFFYGGSWSNGNRDEYLFVGEALASRGIVAVIADYRLYPQVKYPQFLDDCALAVAWTFAHIAAFGGDIGRIFIGGHSAGAYNAAMMVFDPQYLARQNIRTTSIAGFIGLAGPYNFLPIDTESVKPVFDFPNTPASSQPINHIRPGAPPSLLIAAKKDTFVNPVINTEAFANALTKAGDSVVLKEYDGVTHVTLIGAMAEPLRGLAPVLADVVGFVEAH